MKNIFWSEDWRFWHSLATGLPFCIPIASFLSLNQSVSVVLKSVCTLKSQEELLRTTPSFYPRHYDFIGFFGGGPGGGGRRSILSSNMQLDLRTTCLEFLNFIKLVHPSTQTEFSPKSLPESKMPTWASVATWAQLRTWHQDYPFSYLLSNQSAISCNKGTKLKSSCSPSAQHRS